MSLAWCHIPSGFKHVKSPSMTSAFQQGKLMQWWFGKGEEIEDSLHSDSPIEQPPRRVQRCMLCQKLYFKCLIKLEKGAVKKIRVWESIQPYFSYHRWVFAYDMARKFFPHQLSPSLNMTLLANFRSSPQVIGTVYSNYIYVYFAQVYFRKGLISSTIKLPLIFYLKKVATMEIIGLQS